MLVDDVIRLQWELMRLRRWSDVLLEQYAHEGVEAVLTPRLGWSAASEAARRHQAGEDLASSEVGAVLSAADPDGSGVLVRTLAAHLPTFAQIQALLCQAEARRHAVLRDLDQRRERRQRLSPAAAGRPSGGFRIPVPDDDEEF